MEIVHWINGSNSNSNSNLTECGVELIIHILYKDSKLIKKDENYVNWTIFESKNNIQFLYSFFHQPEILELITCPKCKEIAKQWLIKTRYYCLVHGFLKREEVTFNERCTYCGQNVNYQK
jgi:hypothetical protein